MRASVSMMSHSSSPTWWSTRWVWWGPTFHSPADGSRVGRRLGLGLAQAEQLDGPADLVGRLAVDDPGLGVGQQPLGQADLLGALVAGGEQVAQAVDDDDQLHPPLAGQLGQRLQPPGHAEVGQHRPRLVDDHDALGRPPGGRWPTAATTMAQVMSRPRASELNTSEQVEHDGRAVPVDVDVGRPVEHALAGRPRTAAAAPGPRRGWPGPAWPAVVRTERGHRRRRRQQGVDHLDERGHPAGTLVHRPQGQVTRGALLAGERSRQAGAGQGLEQHQLAPAHLALAEVGRPRARVERVEPHALARAPP